MTLQAGTLLDFGIVGTLTTYGLLQEYTILNNVERSESKGPDGNANSIQEHGETKQLSLIYIPLSVDPTGDPVIGTVFTFDSLPWHIDLIEDLKVVDGFRRKSIVAKYYPRVGV